MGMGEPLDNLEHLVRAIRVMSNFPGLGIKNITVSTVGLAPQVYSLLLASLTLTLTLTLTLALTAAGVLAATRIAARAHGLLGARCRRRDALRADAHQQEG